MYAATHRAARPGRQVGSASRLGCSLRGAAGSVGLARCCSPTLTGSRSVSSHQRQGARCPCRCRALGGPLIANSTVSLGRGVRLHGRGGRSPEGALLKTTVAAALPTTCGSHLGGTANCRGALDSDNEKFCGWPVARSWPSSLWRRSRRYRRGLGVAEAQTPRAWSCCCGCAALPVGQGLRDGAARQ